MRAATRLEDKPRNTSFGISEFGKNVGQGEGISRGQEVKYTGADGQTIQGGQYHNKDGTFFKTPEGDTYKVHTENNQYTLTPTKPGVPPIEATSRDVVSNNFGRFGNRSWDDKPPVVAGEKPPVVAGEKPPVVAGEKPPVVAGEKPPVVAGEKPPVVVGEKPPVVVGEKPPVVVGEKPLPVPVVAALLSVQLSQVLLSPLNGLWPLIIQRRWSLPR